VVVAVGAEAEAVGAKVSPRKAATR